MRAEDFLNLARVDVGATADDHILLVVRNVRAVRIQEAHVPCVSGILKL